ncbi:MAG: hypothetical protein PHZ23_16225 [Acidiphilium sp.]|nr:hypothetical protein [Acidiphilium sp.]
MTLSLLPNRAPRGDLSIHTACRQAIEAARQRASDTHDELAAELNALMANATTIAATESIQRAISDAEDAKTDAVNAFDRLMSDSLTPDSTLETEIEDETTPDAGPDPDFLYEQRRDEQMMRAMGVY